MKKGVFLENKPIQKDYLNAILERDNEAIQSIYKLFLPKVIAYVVKNKGSKKDAKDVFDKAVYQIAARLEKKFFTIQSSFEAYLFTACKNLWRRELNNRKKKRVTIPKVAELYYEQKELTQSTLEQERWELFQQKLNELSDNCKEILQLYFDKLSGKQIKETMGYGSETTVRQRVFKCKQRLMNLVKSDSRFIELKTTY